MFCLNVFFRLLDIPFTVEPEARGSKKMCIYSMEKKIEKENQEPWPENRCCRANNNTLSERRKSCNFMQLFLTFAAQSSHSYEHLLYRTDMWHFLHCMLFILCFLKVKVETQWLKSPEIYGINSLIPNRHIVVFDLWQKEVQTGCVSSSCFTTGFNMHPGKYDIKWTAFNASVYTWY